MLVHLTRSPLALLGATATAETLAFEPFVQQTLEFSSRKVVHGTAQVSRSSTYTDFDAFSSGLGAPGQYIGLSTKAAAFDGLMLDDSTKASFCDICRVYYWQLYILGVHFDWSLF